MDELLEGAVASGAVPGIAAVVTSPDGPIYEGAAGTLSVEGGDPVGPDTMFRIMSMTKAFTSVAGLQLLEQGRIGLEQPVAEILPAFGDKQVLDGFDGEEPRLRPPARPATIRHLLTHTSGLAYTFGNRNLLRWAELTGSPSLLTGARACLDVPLVHDPGTRWEYGLSTDWLGLVVEEVSGQTLDAYLAEHVFGPLGMTDATFHPTAEQRARTMEVHDRQPDGSLKHTALDVMAEPEFAWGGGGAWATARDYERFLRAILRGGELDGERVLKPETVDLMFTDHLEGAPLPEVMESAMPELTNDVPSLPFKQGWGLGLHLILEDVPGMRRAGTGDWAGLFNSYYWVDRRTGVAAALMTQVLPFFDLPVLGTLVQLEQAVYAQAGVAAPA